MASAMIDVIGCLFTKRELKRITQSERVYFTSMCEVLVDLHISGVDDRDMFLKHFGLGGHKQTPYPLLASEYNLSRLCVTTIVKSGIQRVRSEFHRMLEQMAWDDGWRPPEPEPEPEPEDWP